jgi:hypothetical protein
MQIIRARWTQTIENYEGLIKWNRVTGHVTLLCKLDLQRFEHVVGLL